MRNRISNTTKLTLLAPYTWFLIDASAQYLAKDIDMVNAKIIAYEVTQSSLPPETIKALYGATVKNTDLKLMARAYADPQHELYHDAGLARAGCAYVKRLQCS
jgi:hypothetical protein